MKLHLIRYECVRAQRQLRSLRPSRPYSFTLIESGAWAKIRLRLIQISHGALCESVRNGNIIVDYDRVHISKSVRIMGML